MMYLRYSPVAWSPHAASAFPAGTRPDTEIDVLDADTLAIDGEEFSFDPLDVSWPDIFAQTDGRIIEARRDDGGSLWLTVRRFYAGGRPSWDDGQYHEVMP